MTLGKQSRKLRLLSRLLIFSALILIISFLPVQAAPHQQAFDCSVRGTVEAEAECNALLAIYTDTGGAFWTVPTDQTTDPCTWAGVTCGGESVTDLDLSTNNLDGSLPNGIGDLINLVTLDLSANPLLTGALPASMTNLTALTTFDFSGTDLCEPQDGAFQTWITGGGLTVTASGILCQIDCGHADTTIDEPECNALIALYNSTTGDSWTDNTNWLYVYDVCTWFGVTCSGNNVSDLVLFENNLDGPLPGEIGDFPFLTNLDLGKNSLSGSIPGQISGLVNLVSLDLRTNILDGVLPNSMGSLSFLTTLELKRNAFTGQVPVSFAALTSLTYLNTRDSTLCYPAALTTWYAGLTHPPDTVPPCAVPPTSTKTPTATATATATSSGSGSPVDPTGTPLPTNTPTITSTPTITQTPTLVFPLQTLTQMAHEATIQATRNTGFRTATTAATATLYYYNPQQKTETQAAIDATANAEGGDTGSETEGGSEQGGSQSGGFSLVSLFRALSKYSMGLVLTSVFVGGGIVLFILMRRRKDEDSPAPPKKGSDFETFS